VAVVTFEHVSMKTRSSKVQNHVRSELPPPATDAATATTATPLLFALT
jgi:hypothetical protein